MPSSLIKTSDSCVKLTMAQALVRYLANQYIETDHGVQKYFAGVWSIFGHGNVSGLGEALYCSQSELPTFRGQNEQGMAHAAIAYAKAKFRQSAMVCTSSIGPGATNLITAAALAHVNRLPVLLLPGDVFANRGPDPVLQQIEDFGDGTISANDCFKPVSRYFDRITRPEQILSAAPRAMNTFIDPASCGPVTLSLCQDVQCEAYDYPTAFFEKTIWRIRRQPPDEMEIAMLAELLSASKRPMFIAGGGVLYSGAGDALSKLANRIGAPIAETQAGKGAVPWDHPLNLGAIGVTGSPQANEAAMESDIIVSVGSRLQDFTTSSRNLFGGKVVQLNITPYDANKHLSVPVVGDAKVTLDLLIESMRNQKPSAAWKEKNKTRSSEWRQIVNDTLSQKASSPFRYTDVISAVDQVADENSIVLCAAGTLPSDLHKLWRTSKPGGYHMEYGYSCMGYEIAGGIGARMADQNREVFVLVGDGSYMMLNSELVTASMMGIKLIVVVLDNGGFGCINSLQQSTGSAPFNNLFVDTVHKTLPNIDFVAHASSMGVHAEKARSTDQLNGALDNARKRDGTSVIVVDVNTSDSKPLGGGWWDVPTPEVSNRDEVNSAYLIYQKKKKTQKRGG